MLKAGMTLEQQLLAISGNNAVAVFSLLKVMVCYTEIDSHCVAGSVSLLYWLDKMGIYGTDWLMLYRNKCDANPRKVILLKRGEQLRMVDSRFIRLMAKDRHDSVILTDQKWKHLDQKICSRLHHFKPAPAADINFIRKIFDDDMCPGSGDEKD